MKAIIIFSKGEDSRKIQEYCFRQGCTWLSGEAKYFDIRTTQGIYIRICDNILTYGESLHIEDAYKVFTSEQFKRKFIKNKLNI